MDRRKKIVIVGGILLLFLCVGVVFGVFFMRRDSDSNDELPAPPDQQTIRLQKNFNVYDSAYYITISRLKDRQNYMEKQFLNQDLVVNKHLGQDKLNLNDNIPKLIKEGYIDKELYTNNKTGFENNGSVACFISHCSLWKKLKNKTGEVFLIFEDDCKLLPNFKNNLNEIYKDVPPNWDMIWLGHNKLVGQYTKNKKILIPKNNPGYGKNALHHCYMIKKSSIDKLLDILLPINSFQSKDSKIRINFDKFNAYFVKQNLAIQDKNKFKKSERKEDKNKFKKSERKEDHDIDIYESVKYEGAVFSGPRDMVSRMKTGKYEKEEIGLLNKMKFTSDDVVLELGGCLGIVSVITNKRLQKLSGGIPKHKVVEANPELLSILKENKSKNKASFDIVHGLVSLDSDGSFYAYDKAVAGSAHRLDNKEKNKREYKVPVLHPSIFADTTVLIMDIEGGELQALQEILPLCPKIRLIMVEIHEFLMYKGFGKKVETLLRSNQFKRSKKSGITYVYERKTI